MTDKVVKITTKQAEDMFLNEEKTALFKGTQFAGIVYFVNESGSRMINKNKALQKLVRTAITVGSNYESRVNRDLEKRGEEGNFTAQGMSGQTRLNKYVSQSDKSGKKNLISIVEHRNVPQTIYFHEGKKISFEKAKELDLFMPSYFEPKKTSGRGNMSEEKDFNYFTVGFDNILSIKIKGVKYIIEN